MKINVIICLLLSLCCSSISFAASSGELVLKNASHADSAVGTSMHDGISQGHDLKIVAQGVKLGRQMAADTEVQIQIRHGNEVYSELTLSLNETGYGEVLFTVPADWSQIYQVTASLDGTKKHSWTGNAPFRVIPAEPGSDVPEATPVMLLAAMLLALGLCWRPLVQREGT